MAMKLSICCVALAQSAKLQALSPEKFEFRLTDIELQEVENDLLAVNIQDAPLIRIRGEPALPIIREAVVLPHESGIWSAKVSNVQTTTVNLKSRKVAPSNGAVPICARQAMTPANVSGPAYAGLYPQGEQVLLENPYHWRDINGAVLQILPVIVDHESGSMEILKSCDIELVSTQPAPAVERQIVDPDFHGVYSSVYANFEHFAERFVAGDKIGRTLIVHESQFKTHAQDYADYVKEQWAQESILVEAASTADSIKNTIKQHYSEDAGLTYVMIVGRNVPTPRGSATSSECDNCYAQINGDTLDVFVGRLSGATATDIETQLAKFKNYLSTSQDTWNEKAHGSCYPAPWDPTGYEQLFKDMMSEFGQMGFSQHEYVMSNSGGAAQKAFDQMNSGIGVFGYIGHGSGTAWNTPTMGVRDIQSLTNTEKHFLSLDCSCDNGGFQSHSPSLAESLLTSKGGAVATMMSAPEIDTCCLDYLRAAPQVLAAGKVTRMGPLFVASLAKAQVAAPDRARTQSYNVFTDPALTIAFLSSPSPPTPTAPTPPAPPTPTPVPTPQPTPVPTPVPTPSGQCHAISAVVTDDWCTNNCAGGFCPSDLCKCDGAIIA